MQRHATSEMQGKNRSDLGTIWGSVSHIVHLTSCLFNKPREELKIVCFSLMIIISGCTGKPMAEKIVDAAIAAHGGKYYRKATIAWDFRGSHFKVERNGGSFNYERSFEDLNGLTTDILDNSGFVRKVNQYPVQLSERDRSRYANSVNSVVYFALLPFPLNDPAVIKTYSGSTSIKGEPYDTPAKIRS